LNQTEWLAASQKEDKYDELLDILLGIPSILELSDQMTSSEATPTDAETGKRLLHERLHETRRQLLNWYWRLQNQECEPLFLVDLRVSTGYSLLGGNPELIGTFSGGILFSDEYVFELLLLYWFAWLMLHASVAREYRSSDQFLTGSTMPLTSEPDDIAAEGCGTLKEIESAADDSAKKLCQTIAFCEKPTVDVPGFQLMLPGLWAALQFFDGRSSTKFRWCQMIFKELEKKGFMLGNVVAAVSPQRFADLAETLRV
jgi:hypothetical protein